MKFCWSLVGKEGNGHHTESNCVALVQAGEKSAKGNKTGVVERIARNVLPRDEAAEIAAQRDVHKKRRKRRHCLRRGGKQCQFVSGGRKLRKFSLAKGGNDQKVKTAVTRVTRTSALLRVWTDVNFGGERDFPLAGESTDPRRAKKK